MAVVSVKLGDIGSHWISACKQAVRDLNLLFKRKGIKVTLVVGGAGPVISVMTDPRLVRANYSADYDEGKLLRAEVRLPVKLTISTPKGIRAAAGTGMAEVIVAHEFVHALGHDPHDTHLMWSPMTPVTGNRATGDKLQAGAIVMPPLQLSDKSVEMLKAIWS